MQKDYKKDGLTIHWNTEKCIHSGNCVRKLNSVFNPKNRPWINTDGGSQEEIKAAIDTCPSGALSYFENGGADSQKTNVEVQLVLNGPARIKGLVKIVDFEGKETINEGIIAICRCGLSNKKPLCDGSHKNMTPKLDE